MLILEERERERDGGREVGRDKERKLTIAAAVTIAIPEKKTFEIKNADEIFSVWYLTQWTLWWCDHVLLKSYEFKRSIIYIIVLGCDLCECVDVLCGRHPYNLPFSLILFVHGKYTHTERHPCRRHARSISPLLWLGSFQWRWRWQHRLFSKCPRCW